MQEGPEIPYSILVDRVVWLENKVEEMEGNLAAIVTGITALFGTLVEEYHIPEGERSPSSTEENHIY